MTEAATTPPAAVGPEEKSGLWLALRVFDEPGQVFQQLARRPRVLTPMLLILVVAAITSFLIPTSVMQDAARKQIEAVERVAPGAMTPERRDQALAKAGSVAARLQTTAAVSIGFMVMLLFSTLIFWIIFSLSGGEVKFKDELSIMLHANMAGLLGYAVVVALSPITRDLQFNLGFAFLFEPGTFLRRFSQFLTVFAFWQMYLLALGNQIKTKARGIGGPLAIVVVVWVVFGLAGAALGGLFGGMMGG